jgi:DNA-binding transcriptional regulator GbsR (MarR family)
MIEIALICKDLYDVITNTIELNSKKDEINKTVNDIDNIKVELNGKDEETMENIIDNLQLDVQIIGLQAIWDFIYDAITAFNVYAAEKIIVKYVSTNVTKIISEMAGKKIIEKIALRHAQMVRIW